MRGSCSPSPPCHPNGIHGVCTEHQHGISIIHVYISMCVYQNNIYYMYACIMCLFVHMMHPHTHFRLFHRARISHNSASNCGRSVESSANSAQTAQSRASSVRIGQIVTLDARHEAHECASVHRENKRCASISLTDSVMIVHTNYSQCATV